MKTSGRGAKLGRYACLAFIFSFSCSWLLLYVDSVHQRHRAERLISDLKSFPFATAGFTEVRDFANSHGGTRDMFPVSQLPRATPYIDSDGKVQVPSGYFGPRCTYRDCSFDIWIRPRILTLARTTPIYSALAYLGIRPWNVYATFEISAWKLKDSITWVQQARFERTDSFERLMPIEYRVNYFPESFPTGSVVHLFKLGLEADLGQSPSEPMQRAFDIHLRCLTFVFHSCSFNELAPSAWADFQAHPPNPRPSFGDRYIPDYP